MLAPRRLPLLIALLLGVVALPLAGCRQPETAADLVLYCSLSEPSAAPIIAAFEERQRLKVRVQYDTEATKSTGLASRLVNEKGQPRADVFWSGEVARMVQLADAGVLATFSPAGALAIPPELRDPLDRWTGFAGRFRVLAYDPAKTPEPPRSLLDLTDSQWDGQVAMANPMFGTTATEAAALFQVLGPERAKEYFQARKRNGTQVVNGNSVSARKVADGDVRLGQTDGSDVYRLQEEGAAVEAVFLDQDGIGALLIPNTVALIAGAPNAANGRLFIEFLVRPETEMMLANSVSRQLPLCQTLSQPLPPQVEEIARVKRMQLDYTRLGADLEAAQEFLRTEFR